MTFKVAPLLRNHWHPPTEIANAALTKNDSNITTCYSLKMSPNNLGSINNVAIKLSPCLCETRV